MVSVSMLGYKDIYKALAAARLELATKMAEAVGGRDEIEEEFDHPFDYTMGYLLRSFCSDTGANERRHRIEEFRKYAGADCQGCLRVFEALLEEDIEALSAGFDQLLEDHKKSAGAGGLFSGDFGDVISIWGVGLANLARDKGLKIEIDDPFLPSDLLI